MLSDDDLAKLCHGRIIYAKGLYRSDETDAAKAQYAVMVDSNEGINEDPQSYFVVCISNNETLDEFRLPVPPRIGLTGWFQCSWTPEVPLPGILSVHAAVLSVPEMIRVLEMVGRARKARMEKAARNRSTRS